MKRWIIAIVAVIVLFAGCEQPVELEDPTLVEITYSIGEPFTPLQYIQYTDADGNTVALGRTISPWSTTIITSRRGEYTLTTTTGNIAALRREMKIECSNGKIVSEEVDLHGGAHSITFIF
jgi:hypothetical protein